MKDFAKWLLVSVCMGESDHMSNRKHGVGLKMTNMIVALTGEARGSRDVLIS